MKTNLFIMLAFFLFYGYSKQTSAQMTSQQQETAKKEIGEVINKIFQNLEKMDAEALFQPYSNPAGFILVTTDGSMVDLAAAKNEHQAWFMSLSSLKVTPVKEDYRFLPGNTIICTWQGNFVMTFRTGMQLKIERFGITFVFSKIDNQWKVIYQHSSASPAVQAAS
jgi:hypothetical protein